MKWNVKENQAGCFTAFRTGTLTAHIYRSLNWPDFFRTGSAAYEVKYGGQPIAVIRFEGKGATVRSLPAAARCPEISDLDLVELALWISKLRGRPSLN